MERPDFNLKYSKQDFPFIAKDEFDYHAEQLIRMYDSKLLECPQTIPIELIIEALGIDLSYEEFRNKNELGKTLMSNGTVEIKKENHYLWLPYKKGDIIISSELEQCGIEGRIRFTEAHELGHNLYHLPKDYDRQNMLFDIENTETEAKAIVCKREDIKSVLDLSNIYERKETIIKEWQANRFASSVLMPRTSALSFARKNLPEIEFRFMEETPLPFETLSYYEKQNFIKNFAECFAVSKEAAKIRLQTLGIVPKSEHSI